LNPPKLDSFEIGYGPDSVLIAETRKMRDNVPVAASPSGERGTTKTMSRRRPVSE